MEETNESVSCSVCDCKLNLFNRKKHCSGCGNAICKKHAFKREIAASEVMSFCPLCDRALMKNTLTEELKDQLNSLRTQVSTLKTQNTQLDKDANDSTKKINSLKTQLTKTERDHKLKENRLKEQLKDLQEEAENQKKQQENTVKQINELTQSENEIDKESQELEGKIEQKRTENEEKKQRKLEVMRQYEDLSNDLMSRVPLAVVTPTLCQSCIMKLNSFTHSYPNSTILEQNESNDSL